MSEKKTYQRVAEEIAVDISTGRYRSGERLPSARDLALRFDISLANVREAMIVLETMGLIQWRQGYRAIVRGTGSLAQVLNVSHMSAFDLIEARRLLGCEMAALAATLIDKPVLIRLGKLLARMPQTDFDLYEAAVFEFNLDVARVTQNIVLITMAESLWDPSQCSPDVRHILRRAMELRPASGLDDFEQLLRALRHHDPQGARIAVQNQFARILDDLLEVTEKEAIEQARLLSSRKREGIATRFSKSLALQPRESL